MYNVSFGKITPQAERNAMLHLQGMQLAANLFRAKSDYEALEEGKATFERAKNDPDYLFDINPDQFDYIDKNGQPRFNDENSFTIYKTGKGNDKYCYLGKCKFLSDGYKLADEISGLMAHYKNRKEYSAGAEKVFAVRMLNADRSMGRNAAIEAGKKLLDLVG